jgi:hypothetical protein
VPSFCPAYQANCHVLLDSCNALLHECICNSENSNAVLCWMATRDCMNVNNTNNGRNKKECQNEAVDVVMYSTSVNTSIDALGPL